MSLIIKLKVKTDSIKESFEEVSKDKYLICLKEPAKDNRANKRLLEILRLKFPKSIIRIIRGHHTPTKLIETESKVDLKS